MAPNDYRIPIEANPYMGVLLAAHLHKGGVSNFLRQEPTVVLRRMAEHIQSNEPLMNPFLDSWDLPILDGPSWWMSDVLPAVNWELKRRTKPRRSNVNGPVARLEQLDIVQVAEKHTMLERAGHGKLKGLCPLHDENTPSFYIYVDSQRWQCFGACAGGGSVISLLARLSERRSING